VNSFTLATQISWTLQAAIAITFAVALFGLAIQLKRSATGALAIAWLWTTVGLTAVAIQSFIDNTGSQMLPTLIFGGLTIAGISGSLPAFEYAANALTGAGDDRPLRTLIRRSATWAGGGLLVAAAVVLVGTGPLAAIDRFVGIVGRLVIVVLYVRLTFHVLARRRASDARFTAVLAVFAAASLLQAIRPLLVLLLFQGPPSTTIQDPSAIAFIGFHVFAGTTFGVACLLLALAEERAAMLETGRQLRDAALRLERSHRLESVGRLASGVAHDFNNLLTVIASSAELARQSGHGIAHVDVELAEIEKAAERGADLTRQLLAFARRQPQHVDVFDIGERLRHMTSLLERLVGRHIALEVRFHAQPALVEMDPSTFEQVVLNLVANARDAITRSAAQSGRIVVTTAATVLESTRPFTASDLAPGRYVSLAVTDSGCGIDAEVMDRIFEPFFTTRHDDGGTGLGLATVQSIARLAGGDVSVESPSGAGATFTVLLPATEAISSDG
jgi:signal transduction histidine kinase